MKPAVIALLFASSISVIGGRAIGQTVTATSARIPSAGSISASVPIDPYSRSLCTFPRAKTHHGTITLSLEGLEWNGWRSFCEKLTSYLDQTKLPHGEGAARDSERLLAATGYFAEVHCDTDPSGAEITCAMSPQPIVADVSIDGDIPFALTREEVRRQVFLRPGRVLTHERSMLEDQRTRLESFMERSGYFNSTVEMRPEEMPGSSPPNLGIKLRAIVHPGMTANVRYVRVQGRPVISRDDIEGRFKHFWVLRIFPRRFTLEQFQSDVDDLVREIRKNGHPEARVDSSYQLDQTHGAVDIDLRIQPGPKLVLHFEGSTVFDTKALTKMSTFIDAGTTDDVEMENTKKHIIEAYQSKGHYDVRVDAAVMHPRGEAHDSTETKRIEFRIEEGPTAEVEVLRFHGNDGLAAGTIIGEAPVKSTTSGTLHTARWIDRVVAHDKRAIADVYRRHGFAEATVDAERNLIAPGKLAIDFVITEGPSRKVESLSIVGLPKEVDLQQMMKQLKLTRGAPFVDDDLGADRRTILTTMASLGWPRATVSRAMKLPPKDNGGPVTIVYHVAAGQRSLLGGVLVRGNVRTSEGLIRDGLSLSPDDPLDLVALSDAKQRLRKLGVFSAVNLQPLDYWRTSSRSWMLAEVEERNRRTIYAATSYRTDELFAIGADASDNNLFGRAMSLDLSVRWANAGYEIANRRIGLADRALGRLTQPRPFGLPFDVSYSGAYDFEDKPRYRLRDVSGSVDAHRDLLKRTACSFCPHVAGSLFYRLSSTDLVVPVGEMNIPQTVQNEAIRLNQLLLVPNQTIARIGPRIAYDRLDTKLDPHSGFSGDATLEFAHPVLAGPLKGTAPFWRGLLGINIFVDLGTPVSEALSSSFKLGGPIVLATGIRYTMAKSLGSSPVPLTETFAYGGDLSVRGIQENASTAAFLGATYMITASLEIRYYLLETPIGTLQLAAISDSGFVSYNLGALLDSPTVTAGGAMRFVTPVGPISVAYAWPIVRPIQIVQADPNAEPLGGRFHFTFGYTF
jgi:outer membrane protein assembly factor BamA